MQSSSKLIAEVSLVHTLHDLVQTYEQVYVSKIRQIRDEVIGMRTFIEGLSDVYNDLRYVDQLNQKESKKNTSISDETHVKDNLKEVAVLLTTSTPLPGEINHKVFDYFWDYVQKKKCDVVIIGKTGETYFMERAKDYPYQSFDIPDDKLAEANLKDLSAYLLNYSNIQVFYGKYKSLLTQQEIRTNLKGEVAALENTVSSEKQVKLNYYIFEPNIDELMAFFEKHIFDSLMLQTMNESYLSQVGSRIVALESAINNINMRMKRLDQNHHTFIKRRKNKKQLQAFAGMSFWKL